MLTKRLSLFFALTMAMPTPKIGMTKNKEGGLINTQFHKAHFQPDLHINIISSKLWFEDGFYEDQLTSSIRLVEAAEAT